MSEDQQPATVRVVAGQPTAEELAAVVAVLAARRGGPADAVGPATEQRSPWSAYWRRIRETPRPGPGAWRASGLPR